MHSEQREYFPEIDGLRGVAILAVLFFHLGISIFAGGFVGVDVFFVISGFLITNNIIKEYTSGEFGFLHFYYRRIRRLFPAILFTTIISFFVGTIILSPGLFERFSDSLIYALFSISNIFFFNEAGYFDISSSYKPLLHFWSLAVEEQFYLVWPMLLVSLLFFKNKKHLFLGFLILGISSIALAEYMILENPDAVFYLTPFRIMEFSLGALCLWVPESKLKNWHTELGNLLGLGLIFLSVFSFNESTLFPGVNSLLPCLGAAFVIVSRRAQYTGRMLRNKLMVRIGLISYSLYLIHWPIIVYYSYWKFAQITGIEKVFLIVIAFLCAELMYRYVEQTFRLKNNVTNRVSGSRFFVLIALSFVMLVSLAFHAKTHDGWEWRITSTPNQIIGAPKFGCRNEEKTKELLKCFAGSNNQDAKKVLLLGDSHAEHLITALDFLGKELNFRVDVSVHPGCPPLWSTYKVFGESDFRRRQANCKATVPEWEKNIVSGEYDYVILASRWMELYEPEGKYGDMWIRRDFLVDRNNPVPDVESSRELFVSRLQMTVDNIVSSGGKAIVFSQVPLLGKDIRDCNSIPTYIYPERLLEQRCASNVDYANTMYRLEFTNDTIRGLSSNKVLSIIPSDYICDQETQICKTIIDNILIYEDSNHLSTNGSLILGMMIKEQFSKFFSGE